MRYSVHKTTIDQIGGKIRKMDKKFKKSTNVDTFWSKFEILKPLQNPTGAGFLANENLWHQSKKIIYPESKEFVESLAKSKISSSSQIALLPFLKSFIFAIPEGTEVDGIPLRSFVYSCVPATELTNQSIKLSTKTNGSFLISPLKAHQGKLIHSVSLYAANTESFHIMCNENEISDMLKADSFLDATQCTGFSSHFENGLRKDDAQQLGMAQCFMGLKLVANLLALHQATNGECIEDGYPIKNLSPKRFSTHSDTSFRALTVHSPNKSLDRSTPVGHVRSFHFRSLSDERYYKKPEYKDMKRGSRIVFVSGSVVGDINPSSLKDTDIDLEVES